MPHKRGKRWTASGYSRELKRKVHLGTYSTRREAAEREAEHKLSTRPTGRETVGSFAGRWVTDYPRPRLSTNISNADWVRVPAGVCRNRQSPCTPRATGGRTRQPRPARQRRSLSAREQFGSSLLPSLRT
jgi:hypothetical protein